MASKIRFKQPGRFIPIAGLAAVPHVLVATPQLQVNTVAEFVALAKSQPGKYTFASTGNGTPAHLVGEIFKREAFISTRSKKLLIDGQWVPAASGREMETFNPVSGGFSAPRWQPAARWC